LQTFCGRRHGLGRDLDKLVVGDNSMAAPAECRCGDQADRSSAEEERMFVELLSLVTFTSHCPARGIFADYHSFVDFDGWADEKRTTPPASQSALGLEGRGDPRPALPLGAAPCPPPYSIQRDAENEQSCYGAVPLQNSFGVRRIECAPISAAELLIGYAAAPTMITSAFCAALDEYGGDWRCAQGSAGRGSPASSTAYALWDCRSVVRLFIGPTIEVYKAMVVRRKFPRAGHGSNVTKKRSSRTCVFFLKRRNAIRLIPHRQLQPGASHRIHRDDEFVEIYAQVHPPAQESFLQYSKRRARWQEIRASQERQLERFITAIKRKIRAAVACVGGGSDNPVSLSERRRDVPDVD